LLSFLPGPVVVPGVPSVPIRPAGKGIFILFFLWVVAGFWQKLY